jgi:hypothetical protein
MSMGVGVCVIVVVAEIVTDGVEEHDGEIEGEAVGVFELVAVGVAVGDGGSGVIVGVIIREGRGLGVGDGPGVRKVTFRMRLFPESEI